MLGAFRSRLGKLPGVTQVRGQGLMIGIELSRPCGELVTRALEQGLLINVTQENVIRLLPPLVIRREEAQQIVDMVSALVAEHLAQTAGEQAQ
jgi:acetylornithine aminotransferase